MGNFDLKEAAISISKQLGEPEWLLEFRLKCLQSYQAATFDKGIQAAANMLEEAAGTMKETWHGKGSVRLGGDAEFESLHSLAADSEFEQKARKAVEMAAGKFEKLDFLAGALFTSWIVARARKKSGRAKVWLGFGKPGRFGVVQLEVPKECTVGLEIENDSSGFAKGASGGCLQCTVGKNASVSCASLNRNMGGALEAFSKRFDVQKGAKVLVDEASLGCGTSVLSTRSFLVGESASSHYNGIFYGFGNARYYFQQDAVHDAQGTENQIFAKGALDGGAVSNFNGLLKISRQAQLSTTDFREKVLMLSDSAQSFSMPSLDVQNNDVSAAHGAAVGQPEEEELFYLKTRGLGEAGAKSIITRGFYQECLARMDKEAGARFVKELNPIIGFVDDIG